MCSGSYFPPPAKRVGIPKKQGGTRYLGVPTVADRIAQTVVKQYVKPIWDELFHPDSLGYRPNRSAKDAIARTRERCWQHDWVVEFDIKGAFDNIDHGLLMKAVRKHTPESWMILYIERWLVAPVLTSEGETLARTQGVPQGGVISPLLMNLFMHYPFDNWMQTKQPGNPFVRYADDAVIH
jgi:group II intron reverse transcriptase/maturase